MKKLLVYLKNYKGESVCAPLFKLLEAVFELIVPLIVASIIDRGIADGDRAYIVQMCLVLVGLGVVGMVSAITAQYFAAKAAAGFGRELRHDLFDKISCLSFAQIDLFSTSSLITRITSDVNQVQSGVNLVLRLFMRSPFIVGGAVVMAFVLDSRAGLIFAGVVAMLCVVIFGIMAATMPRYKKIQSALDGLTKMTRENLTGARVIRAFCAEEREQSRFIAQNNLLNTLQKATGRISALLNPVTLVIINVGIVLLIEYGAFRVDTGALSQGQVVALYNYMSQILIELLKLANLIITVTKSFASAGRITAVLSADTQVRLTSDKSQKDDFAVSFSHVSFSYHTTGKAALSDISFTAGPGEVIGVIGSTGSGKSTLVNLIPRFYDAQSGRITLFGREITSYTRSELKKLIGVVPQKAVLFQGTIADNLRWADEKADEAVMTAAVQAAQAQDVVDSKGGLDAQVEQEGRNFSGGQRQRLSIARALTGRPPVLILDDSASALDFATEKRLRGAIRSLPYHPVVFMVSQRSSTVMHADKIIVLDEGRAVGIGTHDELMRTCGVYREIYDSQFKGGEA